MCFIDAIDFFADALLTRKTPILSVETMAVLKDD